MQHDIRERAKRVARTYATRDLGWSAAHVTGVVVNADDDSVLVKLADPDANCDHENPAAVRVEAREVVTEFDAHEFDAIAAEQTACAYCGRIVRRGELVVRCCRQCDAAGIEA